MDFEQLGKDLHLFWQTRPVVIVLLVLGFLIFVFLVIDARRHKRRRRGPRQF